MQNRAISNMGWRLLPILAMGLLLSCTDPTGETTFTVSFDSRGATVAASPETMTVVSPATTVDALPAPPTRTGYVFGGWFTAADGAGTEFTAATAVSADVTVYARWTAVVLTVTFDGQNATLEADPRTKAVTFPAATVDALPTPPTRTDCVFGGWFTATNGGGTEFTATTSVSADVTVYAKWTRNLLIGHGCANLASVPAEWIAEAKARLHIAYGHTSHGSQLIDGMNGLATWKGANYAWNPGGTGGALDLRDTPFQGAYDLGNPDRTSWASATRTYLGAHPEVNVILWSWCGQADTDEANIANYLSLMSTLETEYPEVRFVYMTGHLNGTGTAGNLNRRNEQIRAYCRGNGKVLYDFADIESYDPDGNEFLSLHADDGCNYDSDGNGSRDRNWATDWQSSHTQGVDWYSCPSAHSQALNANRKAYAAWCLWARLAGWNGL